MYNNNFYFTVSDCINWFKAQKKANHNVIIKLLYHDGDYAYCKSYQNVLDWNIVEVTPDYQKDVLYAEPDGSNWIITVKKGSKYRV